MWDIMLGLILAENAFAFMRQLVLGAISGDQHLKSCFKLRHKGGLVFLLGKSEGYLDPQTTEIFQAKQNNPYLEKTHNNIGKKNPP